MTADTLTPLARALLDDLDTLVDEFLAELALVEHYSSGAVPQATLRDDATRSFQLILGLLTDTPVPGRAASVSADVGAARAEAGVPLDALLHAVRLDFRVVWQALYAKAEPADMAGLVSEGPRVWEAVEQHSMGVLAAYQQRVLEAARAEQGERARWFTRLLDCDGQRADVRRQVATVLSLAEDADFTVVLFAPEQQRKMRAARDRLAARGVRLHTHERATGSAIVVQLRDGERSGPKRWFRNVPCAFAPVAHGLAEVPRTLRLAEMTLHVLPETAASPVATTDLWTEVTASRLGEVGAPLADDVLGEIDRLPARAQLLDAVHAYLSTGSLADSARQLYCHRNTVLNRLHRFAELTGRDVTSPTDATVVALALAVRGE